MGYPEASRRKIGADNILGTKEGSNTKKARLPKQTGFFPN
jgi:hypothetical protein